MGFSKDFSNTLVTDSGGSTKREITKLTELSENDKKTIFNLIFAEAPGEGIEENKQ